MGVSASQSPQESQGQPAGETVLWPSVGTRWLPSGPALRRAQPRQPGVQLGPRDLPAPSCSSFLQGVRQQMIRRILKGWHLRAWHLGTPSGSARSTLAAELLANIPGGEASLGCGTARLRHSPKLTRGEGLAWRG